MLSQKAAQVDLAGEITCPITLQLINTAATTKCGHLFERDDINKCKICPTCRAPITTPLQQDKSAQRLVDRIKEQLALNETIQKQMAELQAQNEALKAENEYKKNLAELHNRRAAPESKEPATIPEVMQVALYKNEKTAQALANITPIQKSAYYLRRFFVNMMREKAHEIGKNSLRIKAEEKNIRAESLEKQTELQRLMKNTCSRYDTNNVTDEKQDNTGFVFAKLRIFSTNRTKAREETLIKLQLLEKDRQENLDKHINTFLQYFVRLYRLNKVDQTLRKNMEDLYATQEKELQGTRDTARQLRLNNTPKTRTWARKDNESLLFEAVYNGDLATAEQLFSKYRFNLEKTNQKGLTFLAIAATRTKPNFALVELLIKNGARANFTLVCEEEKTPSITCIFTLFPTLNRPYFPSEGDQLKIISVLLAAGAEVNAPDKNNDTALHWAAWKGRPDLIKLLLEHGANPLLLNTTRNTALDELKRNTGNNPKISEETKNEIMDLLKAAEKTYRAAPPPVTIHTNPGVLFRGAQQHLESKKLPAAGVDEEKALVTAVKRQDINAATTLLLTHQFDLEKCHENNQTFLCLAIHTKNLAMMQLLLAFNANSDILVTTGKDNKTMPLLTCIMTLPQKQYSQKEKDAMIALITTHRAETQKTPSPNSARP